jgi:hypothetical protein
MHDVRQACHRRAEQARQQGRLELPPITDAVCSTAFSESGPGVDARGDDRLHRVGHQARIGLLDQPVGAALAREGCRLPRRCAPAPR